MHYPMPYVRNLPFRHDFRFHILSKYLLTVWSTNVYNRVLQSNAIGPTVEEHDGMCAPYPAGDKRVFPKAQTVKVGLVEWIVHHPRCIMGKDRDLWQALFDLAGHETLSHAYERMPGGPEDKIWFSVMQTYINANYEQPK